MKQVAPKPLHRLLRRHRERLRLTQEELAERSEDAVSVSTIRNIEHGRTRPYRHTLEQVMAALDLDEAERAEVLAAWRPHTSSPSNGSPGDESRRIAALYSLPVRPVASGLRALGAQAPGRVLGTRAGALALVVIAAVVLGVASFEGRGSAARLAGLSVDASWGSSIEANSADTAIRSTAHRVTVSNPFPDGSTAAMCFIQVTSGGGVQRHQYGSCARRHDWPLPVRAAAMT